MPSSPTTGRFTKGAPELRSHPSSKPPGAGSDRSLVIKAASGRLRLDQQDALVAILTALRRSARPRATISNHAAVGLIDRIGFLRYVVRNAILGPKMLTDLQSTPECHPNLPHSRSPAAERMARYRRRRRDRMRCVTVELRESEINQLIRCRLLAPASRADPFALRKAVHGLLDQLFW